jgi:hypothetical protein
MVYAFIFILILIIFLLSLVYIRKTMWDAVHQNLLDLEDHFGGKVLRRSFAARPVFHGKIHGKDITLNFSTDKKDGKRYTYMDISMSVRSKFNCTLANLAWLEKQETGSPQDILKINNADGYAYVLRPGSDQMVKNLAENSLIEKIINEFKGMAYIFIGKSGMLCEFETSDVVNLTKLDILKERFFLLNQLAGIVG